MDTQKICLEDIGKYLFHEKEEKQKRIETELNKPKLAEVPVIPPFILSLLEEQ
jgi:hypothetical protein